MFNLFKSRGLAHVLRQVHSLNELGRYSLDDATYQISRLYALWSQKRRIVKACPPCGLGSKAVVLLLLTFCLLLLPLW